MMFIFKISDHQHFIAEDLTLMFFLRMVLVYTTKLLVDVLNVNFVTKLQWAALSTKAHGVTTVSTETFTIRAMQTETALDTIAT